MKHLESFKSETIQSIWDFLEQDADVTKFKRDLIAVAKYKNVDLQDLEAELFQYHELMKEDLSNKITFVFREDGYLGMFGEGEYTLIDRTEEAYKELKTGDLVSVIIDYKLIYGTLFKENRGYYDRDFIYLIQDSKQGSTPDTYGWEKYGLRSWCLFITNDFNNVKHNGRKHHDLKKYDSIVPKLITDKRKIKELKDTMHFALVV